MLIFHLKNSLILKIEKLLLLLLLIKQSLLIEELLLIKVIYFWCARLITLIILVFDIRLINQKIILSIRIYNCLI